MAKGVHQGGGRLLQEAWLGKVALAALFDPFCISFMGTVA